MRLVLLALLACQLPEAPKGPDYREPLVGLTGLGGVLQCMQNPLLPCGWVHWFDAEVELCLPWPERSEIPKLLEMAESIYGQSELSRNPRFGGTPLCYYQCPSARGCNAYDGCFCLDEVE